MTSGAESSSDEHKILATHQLSCVTWQPTQPLPNSCYIDEIKETIQTKFPESSAEMSQQISKFNNLRNLATSALGDGSSRSEIALNNLKRYYAQLKSMFGRFKDCPAEFYWADSTNKSTGGNLNFEIKNVMFCIAAFHNDIASKLARDTESQIKDACQHYRNAMWWIKELQLCGTDSAQLRDLSHDMLKLLEHLSSAHAHECLLCHSNRAGFKPESLARIALQIVSDYDAAYLIITTSLNKTSSGSGSFKTWLSTIEFKKNYYKSAMNIFLCYQYGEDKAKEIGTHISYLKVAREQLSSIKSINMNSVIGNQFAREALSLAEKLVSRKLDKAIRYNDNIYHAPILNPEDLPAVERKQIATPLPFNISTIPDFKDLFASLVTIEAIEKNSLYSQKKDDMWREIKHETMEKDEQLARLLSTLNLNEKLKTQALKPPDELVDLCAELSMNPNVIDDLLNELEELDDKLEMVQNTLDKCSNMLDSQRNKSMVHVTELQNLISTQKQALQTSSDLHKLMTPELQMNLRALATTEDPSELLPGINLDCSNEAQIVASISRLVDQVEELKRHRVKLLNELGSSLEHDDFFTHMAVDSSEQKAQEIFETEIKKHNKFVNPLKANLKAQDKILDELEKVNAEYGEVKIKYKNQRRLMNEKVEYYKKLYQQFGNLKGSIADGNRYAKPMLEKVENLLKKIQTSMDLNDFMN